MGLVVLGGIMKSEQKNQICKDGICLIDNGTHTSNETSTVVAQEGAVIEITADNFDTVISNTKKPVIIDFYATWCAPCKYIKPIFAQLAEEQEDFIFCSLDVDKTPVVTRCSVTAMPTFVIFKGGVQWGMIKGALEKEELRSEIKKIIDAALPMPANQKDNIQQLIMAIGQRNFDEVKKLVAEGIDVNGALETPQGNISALQAAIVAGTEEMIDFLMNAGAIMNKSVEEATRKHIDTYEGITEKSQQNFTYIKNKIALSTPSNRIPTISEPELGQQFMMAMGDSGILKQLIDKGVDVNTIFIFGKYEVTPIYLAALLNNKSAIDMLIDTGASLDIEITDEYGYKKSVENVMGEEIEKLKQGIIKGKERLIYTLNKT